MKTSLLPKLSCLKCINDSMNFLVHNDDELTYDVILGLDFLTPIGLNLHNVEEEIHWHVSIQPYHPFRHYSSTPQELQLHVIESLAASSIEDELPSSSIMDARYEAVDTTQLMLDQQHLSPLQRNELAALLDQFKKLFDGTLGIYPHKKMHLDLIDGA